MKKPKPHHQHTGIAKSVGGMQFKNGFVNTVGHTPSNNAAIVGAACQVWLMKRGIYWTSYRGLQQRPPERDPVAP